MRLRSARQFLENCSPRWQPVRDVSERCGHIDCSTRQILMLRDEGDLIELDGLGNVRLTDAGLIAVMEQGPGWTDLYDKTGPV